MFGLVRKSQLLSAEEKALEARVGKSLQAAELAASKERVWELLAELKAAEARRDFAEAELRRLTDILVAHPIETPEPAAPAAQTAEEEPAFPRPLTAIEVVTRATAHRNQPRRRT